MKTQETEESRNAKLTQLGLALIIARGPYPGVDNHDQSNWPHIAFDVVLQFKGRDVLTTPYKLGVGHVDRMKARTGSVISNPRLNANEESLLLTWQSNPHAQFKDKDIWASVASKLAAYQKVKPELDDVLHSLLSDGEAFFNAQSFESWASDFGYDPDSRKAEAIYRACDAIGRKLAASIPREVLDAAREIVRDL